MADPKKPESIAGPLDAEARIKRLEAENAALKAAAEAAKPPPPKGSKSYRVGSARAYHDGRLYMEGEIITVPADFVPSITWSKLDDEVPAQGLPTGPAVVPVRMSDQEL
jgi:hypothetical protein